MFKNFLEWMKLKEKLHIKVIHSPYVREGEKWWVYMGENIGEEINGKGVQFTRPAIIYKKLGSNTFLIIPTTSKEKQGTWFAPFYYKGRREIAVLSQIRIISNRRLQYRVGELDEVEMEGIQNSFESLYFKNKPSTPKGVEVVGNPKN